MPKVSIVMPVFNREIYVCECIDSILSQSFSDFEFIIIDDGSTDGTVEAIECYDDRRIILKSLPKNCGISAARNVGLALASGELIALMDSDNIAMPERLETQISFLNDHREIDILGSGIVKFFGNEKKPQKFEMDDSVIKSFLIYMNGSSLSNATAMIRHEFLDKHQISYRNILIDEDHALWIDSMKAGAKFSNIEEYLVNSRRHDGNITSERSPRWLTFQAQKTSLRAELLGIWFSDLSYEESRCLARFMELGASLEIEEVGLGLAAAAKVTRYRANGFGASQPHINAIILESCKRVKGMLKQVLQGT